MKPETKSTDYPNQSSARAKLDPEVRAMQAISRIMDAVAPAARDRVLQYVVSRYAADAVWPDRIGLSEKGLEP